MLVTNACVSHDHDDYSLYCCGLSSTCAAGIVHPAGCTCRPNHSYSFLHSNRAEPHADLDKRSILDRGTSGLVQVIVRPSLYPCLHLRSSPCLRQKCTTLYLPPLSVGSGPSLDPPPRTLPRRIGPLLLLPSAPTVPAPLLLSEPVPPGC